MTLRINHNIAALNSWRNLTENSSKSAKTLEKLSSGLKINRAADGPATLVISEQMRSQISSLKQAVGNSEIAVSMVQTAEGALNEVNNILVRMRQLSIHAANEGANDATMLAADQAEIENALKTIDRISKQTQFGTRFLLDGSNGSAGVTVGDDLRFVSASTETKNSPPEGYVVDITQVATKAKIEGSRTLTAEEQAKGGVTFTLSEGGKSIVYTTEAKETIEVIMTKLQRMVANNGLKLDLSLTEDKRLHIEHQDYGSIPTFNASVSAGGLLTKEDFVAENASQGQDVAGTIGGEVAFGKGQYLSAAEGTKPEGVVVQFTGELAKKPADTGPKVDSEGNPIEPEEGTDEEGNPQGADENGMVDTFEGYVHVTNNSLMFQVGPNRGQTTSVNLLNTQSNELAKGIENESNFKDLSEIDVTSFRGAEDSLMLIDAAANQVSDIRSNLGAFQKNTLESNLTNLRYATENMVAAESSVRDTDMAEEMSEFTRNQIMMSSGTAMLAQANQIPKAVLTLLNGGGN